MSLPRLPELLIILLIVLLIFGAGKLPEIAGSLGKSIREFRKESSPPPAEEPAARQDAKTPEANKKSGPLEKT